jgi:dihydrofolate reductase
VRAVFDGECNTLVRDTPQSTGVIMGQILVHEFISLDGVFEAPRWTMEYGFDPKMGDAIGGIMGPCKAILLGRQTFEEFAPAWSGRTAEQDPGAPFMNETPKYVVSETLQKADWNNSTIIDGYSAETIGALKDQVDGGIYISGSGALGLVDELNLFVYPVVLGTGARLFGDEPVKFTLAQTHSYENGVLHLAYQRA